MRHCGKEKPEQKWREKEEYWDIRMRHEGRFCERDYDFESILLEFCPAVRTD
jgi:hypothetical protein